jgi:AcrR family transcriptional regulator
MSKRAEDVEATRRRIVDAAVQLHGTVGPAGTTIAGIAAEAGVTRLTVYRHVADDESLFAACTAHWFAQQVPPDPEAWSKVADPEGRLRAALTDLYRFYRDGQDMLTLSHRDRAALPASQRERLAARTSTDAICCWRRSGSAARRDAGSGRCSGTRSRSRPGGRCAWTRACRTPRPSTRWSRWRWRRLAELVEVAMLAGAAALENYLRSAGR